MTTTAFELDGYRIVKNFGVVRGIIVRSRSIFGTIGAGLQTLVGGNITILTDLCEKTRQHALEQCLQHAQQLGANAIIGLRYDATEIMQGVTEVLCYGTAVLVEPQAMNYCADPFSYQRRVSREVMVGNVGVGGDESDPRPVDDHLRHDGHGGFHRADDGTGGGRLRDRAHHRADGERRGEPATHRARIARTRLRRADRGRHSFQAGSRDGSGEVGREGADQSRAITPTRRSSRSSNTPTSSTRRN